MVFGVLGKGVGPAHQAADPGTQGPKPTLDMAGFSALVQQRCTREMYASHSSLRVAHPRARRLASAALCVLRSPSVQATIWRVLRQRATHSQRLRLLLQSSSSSSHVALPLGRSFRVSGQFLGFFPPASASPSCSKPRKCGGEAHPIRRQAWSLNFCVARPLGRKGKWHSVQRARWDPVACPFVLPQCGGINHVEIIPTSPKFARTSTSV